MESVSKDFLGILFQYQGIIHKVNLIYFKTDEDREDNFQEVVYHLWKSFPALKDRNKIGSWIYAVAINVSVSKIRKDSRYVPLEPIPDDRLTDETDNIEHAMNFQQLMEAIHCLDEIDKSIMLLYLEEYSYNQIADTIGISSLNVGVRINRAKKQLKHYLMSK